jgi:DNA polymerase III subunit gamma/tau
MVLVSSEVWYRKWRPQTFAEVVGQKHVTQTLARGVANDRVAHAYLFCGPRGTGKTSTARILAKAVNCEANVEGQPCTHCPSCIAVTQGRALDLIEMDAASNRSIEDIRNLRDRVGFSPNSSRYKVYLIDEAHELTAFAFDALLKTLEEPPPHVIFVLATTEAHKVPETIRSRCQRFDFQRIKLADVVGRMQQIAGFEGVEASDSTLEIIARRATGSLRDALNQFEQQVAAQGHQLTEADVRLGQSMADDQRAASLVELMLNRQLADALNLVAQVRDDGADLRQFTGAAVQYLRSVLLVRAGAAASLTLSDEAIAALCDVAEAASVADVLRAARALTSTDFRSDPQSPLPLELALIEFVETSSTPAVAPVAGVPVPAVLRRTESSLTSPRGTPASPQHSGTADRIRSALAPRVAPPPSLRNRVTASGAHEGAPVAPRPASAVAPAAPTSTAPPAVPGGPAARATGIPPAASVSAAVPEPAARPGVSEAPSTVENRRDAEAAPSTAVPADGSGVGARPEEPAAARRIGDDTGAALTLDQAQRRFRELYERCGELDKSAARLLNSGGCDIVEIGAGTVTIGFKHPRMVHLASGSTIDAALRRSVGEIFGDSYGVSYVYAPDVPSRLQLLDAERPSHLLEEALKLGAKPVERT